MKLYTAVLVALIFIKALNIQASSSSFYIIPPCGYENEKLFDLSDPIYNRDNCMYPFCLLREKLQALGYNLKTTTYESLPVKALGIIVCNLSTDHSALCRLQKTTTRNYLLLLEPPTVAPQYYNVRLHKYFAGIFTLCDYAIDKQKYFKTHYPLDGLEQTDNIPSFKEKKFLTIIAGYKHSHVSCENYSERIKSIKYFEQHCSEDEFHLFGSGWDKTKFHSYKGRIDSKNSILKNYKFALCYENTKNVKGYITEKIIDCFKAGCVPIYWGASDVTRYIPSDCFIDRRQFNTHKDLHHFLNSITEKEYNKYQANITCYLKSSQAFIFSPIYFTHVLITKLLGNYPLDLIWSREQVKQITAALA